MQKKKNRYASAAGSVENVMTCLNIFAKISIAQLIIFGSSEYGYKLVRIVVNAGQVNKPNI